MQWRRSAGGVAFSLDLTRLDPRAERLVITLSPERGEGTLSGLRCGELRLGAESWRFSGADFGSEQAIIAAELYRHQGAWRLMVVGQGFMRLAGLADYLGSPLTALSATKKAAITLTKITLGKAGDSAPIRLEKSGGQLIHVNLNWESRSFCPADLDLGCMYELLSGEKGVIQALGRRMGVRGRPPYIYLDQDDRSGASAEGENLYLERPDLLRRALIFTFIYDGVADFREVGGRLSLTNPQGNDVRLRLSNPASLSFCAVALLERRGGALNVRKEERYFADHQECDVAYGFGFQ